MAATERGHLNVSTSFVAESIMPGFVSAKVRCTKGDVAGMGTSPAVLTEAKWAFAQGM